MNNLVIGPNNPLFEDRICNWHEQGGWYFGAGDPEFWKFSERLLKPGGRLLDIGIGLGRSSIYFAFGGMEVLGVDNDDTKIDAVNDMSRQVAEVMPFSLNAVNLDFLAEPLPAGPFDTVIASHLNHMSSKQAAFDLFDGAYAALRPGGHIWVRGVGKESFDYDELAYQASRPWRYGEVKMIDDDVIEHPCTCSGEYRIEPSLYYDQLDLLTHFARLGAKAVHSQTIPTEYKANIMYGEDYNPDSVMPYAGLVTLLAQRPE